MCHMLLNPGVLQAGRLQAALLETVSTLYKILVWDMATIQNIVSLIYFNRTWSKLFFYRLQSFWWLDLQIHSSVV